jgi:hypothetical protein
MAQVVTMSPPRSDPYVQGVRDGLALAGLEVAPEPAAAPLAINGPLAVATANNAQFPFGYPLEYPLVTTSFDRGRSRHLTLRMLLQDQFQLDRDGPYVYYPGPPGLGPNLHPVLPRGLRDRTTTTRVFTR